MNDETMNDEIIQAPPSIDEFFASGTLVAVTKRGNSWIGVVTGTCIETDGDVSYSVDLWNSTGINADANQMVRLTRWQYMRMWGKSRRVLKAQLRSQKPKREVRYEVRNLTLFLSLFPKWRTKKVKAKKELKDWGFWDNFWY